MSTKIKVYDVFDAMSEVHPGEVNSGELLTEQAGYIPPDVQIENMIFAGQRLAEARGVYDFDGDQEIDEDLDVPVRRANYDLADATQDQLALEARLRAQQRDFEASQTAPVAPAEVSAGVVGGSEPPPEKGA